MKMVILLTQQQRVSSLSRDGVDSTWLPTEMMSPVKVLLVIVS